MTNQLLFVILLYDFICYSGRHKENFGPSPRIMSPLGFAVHRQTFPRANKDYYLDDYFYDYYYDYYDYYRHDYNRPVPIWLCVFLVVSLRYE